MIRGLFRAPDARSGLHRSGVDGTDMLSAGSKRGRRGVSGKTDARLTSAEVFRRTRRGSPPMRFLKLDLNGAPAVELPLHRQMTVVSADDEAERRRLAEALAGRAGGVVWAFDDE